MESVFYYSVSDLDYDFNGSSYTTFCTMRSCLQCLPHVSLMYARKKVMGAEQSVFSTTSLIRPNKMKRKLNCII